MPVLGAWYETHLHHRSPKTVNNGLTVLDVLLKKAADWDTSGLHDPVLPIPKPSVGSTIPTSTNG
jgi:hypothetical protein